ARRPLLHTQAGKLRFARGEYSIRYGINRQYALRVRGPRTTKRVLLIVLKARIHPYPPVAGLVGLTDAHLNLHTAFLWKDQGCVQSQLSQAPNSNLVTTTQGKLQEHAATQHR